MGKKDDGFDGWGNSATQGYALVLWNDREKLKKFDDVLLNHPGRLKGAYCWYIRDQINREGWWEGQVDGYDIVVTRLKELIELGTATQEHLDNAINKMTYKGSKWLQYCLIGKTETTTEAVQPQTQAVHKEEVAMHITKVETKHFVNGNNITDMTVDDKVSLIAETEKKLAGLKALTTESAMVKAEIARLEKDLKAAVALFDADVKA